MKNEQAYGKKILAPVAAALALSIGASAQFAGGQVLLGRPVFEASLEGDVRDASVIGRKIVLSRDETRELELEFKMRPRPHAELDPVAIAPTLAEMEKFVMLVNGTPGGMAVIHLETRAPAVRRAGGGVRIAGLFDEDGDFMVQLPDELDTRGLFAWGEQILELSDLVKKPVAGSAARPTRRPSLAELDVIDLGAATQTAFFNWVFYWTDLQLKSSGKASASLEDDTEIGTDPVISEPADPQGGQRAGEKIRLQRPTERRDHVLQHR